MTAATPPEAVLHGYSSLKGTLNRYFLWFFECIHAAVIRPSAFFVKFKNVFINNVRKGLLKMYLDKEKR